MSKLFVAGLLLFFSLPSHAARRSGEGLRVGLPPALRQTRAPTAADTAFAKLVERLSEPGGYFDSDNLISNESSYLHVLGAMRRLGVNGGAYIGVGPDQNFSYIAQVRPRIAFIIDIRRDNLLHHLLFKALFAGSRNRLEYLCLLFAKPAPENLAAWTGRDIGDLLDYLDRTPSRPELAEATRTALLAGAKSFAVPISPTEASTMARIYDAFVTGGLDLRFTSFNRGPRPYYPTYRQLLLEKDLDGKQSSYLANEDAFQFVKSLEGRNLIVPVVGNLAGEHALRAIGQYATERGDKVSALYASNVEFYLMREGSFDRFAETVKQLPRDPRSVIIRSYFGGGFGGPHPNSVPGYFSTQLLQTIDTFAGEHTAGGYQSYWDLVSKHTIPAR